MMPYIEEQQTSADMISEFRGYNHNPVINDNEFYDMENMTSDATPSIETRKKRSKLTITDNGDPIEVLAVTGKEKIMVAYSKEGSNSVTVTADVPLNENMTDDWELIGTDYYIKLETTDETDYRTDWLKEQLKETYDGDTNVRLYGFSNGVSEHPITMNENVERKIENFLWTAEWLTQPFYLFDKVGDMDRINTLDWLYPSGDGWGNYGQNHGNSAIACPSNCDYIGIYYAIKKEDDTPGFIKANCRVYTDNSMYFRDESFKDARVFFGNDSFSDNTAPKTYQVKMKKAWAPINGNFVEARGLVIYDPDHDCPLRSWGYGKNTTDNTFNPTAYNASRKMYVCYGSFNYPSLCYTGSGATPNRGADTAELLNVMSVSGEIELLRKIQPNDILTIGETELSVASVNPDSYQITIRANHPAITSGTVIGYPTESIWLAQLDLSTNKIKNQTIVCDLKRQYDQDGNEIEVKRQIVEMGANIILFPEKYVINTADTEKVWEYKPVTSEPDDWSDYSRFFELDDGEYVQLTAPEEFDPEKEYFRRNLVRERYTKVEEIQPDGFPYRCVGFSFYEAGYTKAVGKKVNINSEGEESYWYVCNTDPVTARSSSTYYKGLTEITYTPPTISDGDVWIDTSKSPNVIKQRVGEMWVEKELYYQLNGSSTTTPVRDGDSIRVGFIFKDNPIYIEHFFYGEKEQAFGIAGTQESEDEIVDAFIPTSQLKFNFPSTDKIQMISFENPPKSWVTDEFYEETGVKAFITPNSDRLYIQRLVPVFDFAIESGNRIWGCRYGENASGNFVNEIFASKLGDPTVWTYLKNTAADSYYVSLGDDGAFTGAVNFNGNPVFFRKDKIHRIMGAYPSQYQLQTISADGVDAGSDGSVTVYNGVVYYNSPHGVMAWSGGIPQNISKVFGDKQYTDGASGHIKNKMYFSMMDGETPVLFCLDTDKGLWCKENDDRFEYLFDWEGKLYGVNGNELTIFEGVGGELEDDLDFMIQSGDIGYTSMNRKYLNKITMRLKLPLGSRATIEIQYDSDGTWRHINELRPTKASYTYAVPIIPHRCDHFSIRIRGKGTITLMNMSKFWKEGTDYA